VIDAGKDQEGAQQNSKSGLHGAGLLGLGVFVVCFHDQSLCIVKDYVVHDILYNTSSGITRGFLFNIRVLLWSRKNRRKFPAAFGISE